MNRNFYTRCRCLLALIVLFAFNNNAQGKPPGPNVPPYFVNGHTQTATVCSGTLSLNALLAADDVNTGQAETWSLVSGPSHGTATVTYGTTSTGTIMTPTGLSYTPTFGYTGTDVITVSVVDTGGIADTTTITITVGAVVSAGVITGPSAVCLGSSINLTDAVSGGIWSVSNGNVTITPGGLVTGMAVGTTTVSYAVTGICGTAVAKGTVTVVDMPGPINGPGNVCTGVTIVLTDAVGGGFWSSNATTIATASPTGGIVYGVKAGTATISYTIGGVCAATSVITVDPPLPAITGPGKVCVGGMVTLSDSVTAGTWSEPSGFVSVNPSTGDIGGITAGTGIITYSVSSGCMAYRAFTVNPNPSPIMLTSAVICYSDLGMYATDADAGGTWTSALVTVSTGGYLTAYATGSGLITYTLPTGCLTTTPITVNPLPALITGPKNICTGELTALADATGGGTWSTTEPTILVDIYSGGLYGVSAGTAVVTYQLPTTCFVTDTITVSQSPTAILGSPNVCIGNLTTLSDAVPGGTWSISAGGFASISPLGTVLGIAAGAATATYTTGSGCTATVPVTIWPLPSLFTVTGGGSYCAGGTGMAVSLTGSVPGTRYYLFNGSTLIDSLMGTGSFLTYGLRTLPGLYTVYAVNLTTQCGNLMSGSVLITIDPIRIPAVGITTVPGDTVCLGGSITFVAGASDGGSAPVYQWKVNGVPAGTGGISYTYVPVDGDLIGVELTSNATCVAPTTAYAFRTVSVVTPVVPVIKLTADPGVSVAPGTTVTYTATVMNKVTAATYQWLKNGTAVFGANSPVFVDNDVRNFDTVSCRVWSGGFCSQTAIERLHMNVFDPGGGNNNTAVHNVTGADVSIRVIPNPSRGTFTVTGTMNEEVVTLELTDMIGRMIYKGDAMVKDGRLNAEVQLSNTVANGTYLLNVRSGAMHKVFHIIIEQ